MWHAVYFNNIYFFPALFVRLNQDWQEEWMARHNNWHNRHVIIWFTCFDLSHSVALLITR